MSKLSLYLIVSLLTCNLAFAQTSSTDEEQISEVFGKLVAAYGSAKSAPRLEINSNGNVQKAPAIYLANPSPTIRVDMYLYKLCERLGDEKNNALSIIISHELAHYYNDHTFCTDFAFAVRKKDNEFSSKLKALSKSEKLALETEADHKGLFYSCMAGYKPFGIYSKLLDDIYEEYSLPEYSEGYPSKEERKAINLQAQQKINELYTIFSEGILAINKGDYDKAITNFESLNNYFPSRENYNNLGVSRTLKALKYKPLSRSAYKRPERFKYPLGVDDKSRLNQTSPQRSLDDDAFKLMEDLLKTAQKDFEKAISLDDSYTQSYINLACVFDLLGNPMAAIGKIKELPKKQQESNDALRVLAIAYYNLDMDIKAEELWDILKL